MKITKEMFSEMKKLRVEGYSYQKIASKYGLAKNTVYQRLNRKPKKLGREAILSVLDEIDNALMDYLEAEEYDRLMKSFLRDKLDEIRKRSQL